VEDGIFVILDKAGDAGFISCISRIMSVTARVGNTAESPVSRLTIFNAEIITDRAPDIGAPQIG